MQIVNNKTNYQFETIVEGEKAELQYRIRNNTLYYMHTWVPESIEGRGIASSLAKFGLEYARRKNYQIVIYCPFVVAYVKKHPEYLELLNTNYQTKEKLLRL
ncbi:MAG: GNAT family N-acetyltransferase [Fulvivirga sp.]|uniref:GNAT family N-acetyltransferase n=1 Tax=Fulvivirga sp. TaxID=1931237 RepID=UPI0032F0590B